MLPMSSCCRLLLIGRQGYLRSRAEPQMTEAQAGADDNKWRLEPVPSVVKSNWRRGLRPSTRSARQGPSDERPSGRSSCCLESSLSTREDYLEELSDYISSA
jgi:hypothetical protein